MKEEFIGKTWTPLVLFLVLALGAACAGGPRGSEPGGPGLAETPALTPDFTGFTLGLFVARGFHDGEALIPKEYFEARNARVVVIGAEEGTFRAYNSGATLTVEALAADLNAADFDAFIIPGGRAPQHLRLSESVLELVRQAHSSGKVLAGICHGPQVLISAGLAEGRRMTAWRDVAPELREAGALYEDAPVIQDGLLVTSRVPEDLAEFNRVIGELLLETRAGNQEPRI